MVSTSQPTTNAQASSDRRELGAESAPLRSPAVVMDIKRLGSLHPSRLSFMRALMRRMMQQRWQINVREFDLDSDGLGHMVYSIQANGNEYSLVLFAHYLADEDRNDRVIAERWDTTMTLCRGPVDQDDIARMAENVPKQEAGRATTQQIVLSRGNRSSRNFAYVVDRLASGQQPEAKVLAKVGYLYRTTAVYGSGKFGMADWETVLSTCPEFASPFSAEMFACFLLRDFSVRQAEHLARIKSPKTAVAMKPEIKRFLGIGNSTGLGMAPYLIRHPQLISRWVLVREQAIAAVTYHGRCDSESIARLDRMLNQVLMHLEQTTVPDAGQTNRNITLKRELVAVRQLMESAQHTKADQNWAWLSEHTAQTMSLETQELLNSLLMELHPELVDGQFAYLPEYEQARAEPTMRLSELKTSIEQHYDWALQIDFSKEPENYFFWYVSEEKLEPRIGERCCDPGEDKEQPLVIAKRVRLLYDALCAEPEQTQMVAQWLLKYSKWSGIVARVQTMTQECYGEIRGNLAAQDMLPLDLLRCKLSFFGVSKFDPKSKLWVRNTMFQGAPILDDVNRNIHSDEFSDDWYFPVVVDG